MRQRFSPYKRTEDWNNRGNDVIEDRTGLMPCVVVEISTDYAYNVETSAKMKSRFEQKVLTVA